MLVEPSHRTRLNHYIYTQNGYSPHTFLSDKSINQSESSEQLRNGHIQIQSPFHLTDRQSSAIPPSEIGTNCPRLSGGTGTPTIGNTHGHRVENCCRARFMGVFSQSPQLHSMHLQKAPTLKLGACLYSVKNHPVRVCSSVRV